MMDQFNLFLESSQQFLNEIAVALPRIIGALLVLILGWIIARLIKKAFIKLLTVAKVGTLTEKTGIDKFLKDGGANLNAIEIIATLFYWTIMLIVIMATLNSLSLDAASGVFKGIIAYLPNVIVAIAMLIIGIYLARMVSQMIKTSLTGMQDKTSNLLGQIAFVTIIIITVFMILVQLNIAREIVVSAFQIIFGATCLALALAFGLGGKDKASEIINDLHKKSK